jgi:hypothetical protein
MITLNLDPNEVNFILQVIGELPTKSGSFPLLMKIKEQAESQANKDAPPPGQ